MAADSYGDKGEPQFAGSGVPQDAADLTLVSEYAAKYGNYRADTAAIRNSLSGDDVWPGLLFFETDTGVTYRYDSTGWAIATTIAPRLRMQRPAAAGISANGWQSVGMSANAQEGGGAFTGGGASFSPLVTGRYAVHIAGFAPQTPSPNRRMIGIAAASNVANPIVQSPGFPSSGDSVTIDHTSEITLQSGTPYVVAAYSTAPLNFTSFDVSVRLIAPTSIG